MLPQCSLPIDASWPSTDAYLESLLRLVTSSDTLRNLCGGVHILDFLTRKPDLYTWVLPQDWRTWLDLVSIDDLLDLLLREPLEQFQGSKPLSELKEESNAQWRGFPAPPSSLIAYIDTVRRHSLTRSFQPNPHAKQRLPRQIEVGMKPKKIHEVVNFAAFVSELSSYLAEPDQESLAVVDFGSGQNYLGRTLALPPHNKHVIAIERHHHNVEGARWMDVSAKLTKKEKIMRNKKQYNLERKLGIVNCSPQSCPTPNSDGLDTPASSNFDLVPEVILDARPEDDCSLDMSKGSMTYIEHELVDGHLEHLLYPSSVENTNTDDKEPAEADGVSTKDHSRAKAIAVSIHSCGNLTHHGLRSLVLNPSIVAVAMIGCCYNLLTERLGPATYKLPQLRSNHPRLEATSNAFDPHGFPMSKRLENFEFDINTTKNHAADPTSTEPSEARQPPTQREKGVRLNITARMMAVQAPGNWTPEESAHFFTRHFYRALLQRILLDKGVVKQALSPQDVDIAGGSLSGKDATGTPLIIGSLRKTAFTSFSAYVRAALEKLWADPKDGPTIRQMTEDLMDQPKISQDYEERFAYAKKHLSVIWSLMAFSAGVVESTIAVDRWLWLKEQDEVEEAWVQTAFGYDQSPRNLVVVGIKKRN